MKNRDNCFLILGLDYRNPDYTDSEIKQKLREKRRYWRANQKDHPEYSVYDSNLMEIEKTLTDPEKRKAEAADAAEYIRIYLEDELAPFDGMEQIPEEDAKRICSGCNLPMELFPEVSGKRIAAASAETGPVIGWDSIQEDFSVPVVEEKQVLPMETSMEEDSPNPQPPFFQRVKKGKKELQMTGFPTLYHFLAEDKTADLAKLQLISSQDLQKEYCESIKQRYRTNHTDEATPIHTLCAICDEIFDDSHPEYRAAYDAFIVWTQIDEIIKELTAGGNILNLTVYNAYAAKLAKILGSTEAGKNKLDEICRYKGITVSTGGTRLISLEKKVVCPRCFKEVMVKEGDTVCPSCGGSLIVYCIRCGRELSPEVQICPECGGDQKELKNADNLLNAAEKLFEQKKFGESIQYLKKMDKIWPGNIRAAELKKKVQAANRELKKEQEYFTGLCFDRKIYEAYQYLQEHSVNAYSGAENVEQIIHKCRTWEEQLNSCKTEKEAVLLSEQILGECPDYPLGDVIKRFPPAPPANLRTEITTEGNILLSWDASDSEGEVSYHVVRKIGRPPRNFKDVDGSWEIQEDLQFLDRDLAVGQTGYYLVFSRRNDKYSTSSMNARVRNMPEISGVHCEAEDGKLELSWNPVPPESNVILLRKAGAVPANDRDGQKIVLGNVQSFQDTKLKNDTFYGYRICLEYTVNGVSCTTTGMIIGGTPRETPKPLSDYTVNKTEDNHFHLVCQSIRGQNIRFFYSAEKLFSQKCGESISAGELEKYIDDRKLIEISMLERFSDGFTFSLPYGSVYQIVPVTCNEEQAVFGTVQQIYSAAPIQLKSIYEYGKSLQIGFEWPEGIKRIMVQYSTLRYANSANEPGFEYVYYTDREYNSNDQIEIQEIEKKKYYFMFYAEVLIDGKMVWVNMGRTVHDNQSRPKIYYKISVKGNIFFRRKPKAVITFSCPGTDSFNLPEIDIYCKSYSVPYYKEEGSILMKIDAKRVDQNHEEIIPMEKIGPETHIRPFFASDEDYDRYDLKVAEGSVSQIS